MLRPSHIEVNKSLRSLNTFRIEAQAAQYAAFSNVEHLRNALGWAVIKGLPVLSLGGGSNLLFTRDWEGLVLHNCMDQIHDVAEDESSVTIEAEGGVEWHRLVMHTVERRLGGLENLSLIPGSVGASPLQNIGAYGVELKDCFVSLTAMHMRSKEIKNFLHGDCKFGYRESVFKHELRGQYMILSVRFRLAKQPVFNTSYGAIEEELKKMEVTNLSPKAISDAVIRIRQEKLPDWREVGNAGSFFKNPVVNKETFSKLKAAFPDAPGFPAGDGWKVPAGWLIESCGWKGVRKGNVGCYPKQALVLVNWGGATGAEVYDLSTDIVNSVHEKFGVELEREVNII